MSTTTFALALDVNNAVDNGNLYGKKCDSSVKIKTPATRKKIPYRIEFHNDNDEDEIFELDAADAEWPKLVEESRYDAIFVSEVLHIAPWAASLGLLAGAARVLAAGTGGRWHDDCIRFVSSLARYRAASELPALQRSIQLA